MNSNNKYGSRKKKDKPKEDGYEFDSIPEWQRFKELKLMVLAGEITDLEVHPRYILKKSSVNNHGQKIAQWAYKLDFKYLVIKGNYLTVEDVKSLRIDNKGKKHGTATKRDYKLSKNEFMRQNPDIKFIEIY